MKKMISLLFATAVAFPSFGQDAVADEDAQDCVILLHGLLRDAGSMAVFERPLEDFGFVVVNQSYESTSADIPTLAEEAIDTAIAACPEGSRTNFITHSMGGILVRAYYVNAEHPRPYRVVMLTPPNQGSEIIDSEAFEWFGGISGQAGAELSTAEDSIPNTLGPVDYPVGIVAGETSVNPVFSAIIPGPDDGAVAVERTHVEGESDWILIPTSHSFVMYNELAQRHALEFLQNGEFTQ